jgi:hypothetical protein
LLYMLLVALMPFRELWMVLTGRSTWARWKAVGLMVAMAAAIGLCLAGEWWMLAHGFGWINRHTSANSALHVSSAVGVTAVAPALAFLPFLILGALIVALHALRLAVHFQGGDLRAPAGSAAARMKAAALRQAQKAA